MRLPIATLALITVLAVAGVATGDLLRGKPQQAAGSGTSVSAAGFRAVGAAWRSLEPRHGRGLHLTSISCRPLDEATTWPLRCVGRLSRTSNASSTGRLPWIEVRLGPGPTVEGCHWVDANALPLEDCRLGSSPALRT